MVIACRADDTTFDLLHSRLHELWSLRMCTWMGKGNDPRYTPTTCFETFPFPAGLTPADTAHQRTEPLAGGACIPAELPPEVVPLGLSTSPYPDRIVARAGFEAELAKRTLTNQPLQPAPHLAGPGPRGARRGRRRRLRLGRLDHRDARRRDPRRLLALNRERAGAP
ncbi:MAG: hypothetical protein ACK57B_06785 [Betaproteobacteria bacterium]